MSLRRRLFSWRQVRHVDLGNRVDLANPHRAFDQAHLTAAGNNLLVGGFIGPVLVLATRRRKQSW